MDLLLTYQCLLGFLALAFLVSTRSWVPSGRRRAAGADEGDQPVPCRLPPEAAGAWPVVGHLPLLLGQEIAARTLGRMADDYGPVFMIRLGAQRTLVISSKDAARDCFRTCDRALASRPRSAFGKYLGYNHSLLGTDPYGPRWREIRKFSAVKLLSPTPLEKLRHVRESEVDMRMGELYQLCASYGGASGPKVVDMGQWFTDTTFNVIVRMVIGERYLGGSSNSSRDDEPIRRFQKSLTELAYLMGMFVLSDAVPWLEWLDFQGYIKAMKRTFKGLDDVMGIWMEEHRQKSLQTESGNPNDGQAFIDLMLASFPGDGDPLDLDNTIKATSLALIAAGMDTSAATMTWALSLLLNHRRVLHSVRQELDLHVGSTRNVEEEDLPNLVNLQAILKETMRLYPVGPLSVPHGAMADCRVGGYHVPAGTRLLTNLWKLHRDSRVWGADAEEFRPERFLPGGEAAGLDVRGQQFEYLPFGSGRRMCPGINLALPVMQLTLGRLVHGFELETPEAAPVDMGEGRGLVLTKATPLEVVLTPRLPRHLYSHSP